MLCCRRIVQIAVVPSESSSSPSVDGVSIHADPYGELIETTHYWIPFAITEHKVPKAVNVGGAGGYHGYLGT